MTKRVYKLRFFKHKYFIFRNFGRYVSKDGYVDSNKSVHRAQMKQKQHEQQRLQQNQQQQQQQEDRKRSRSEEGVRSKNVRIDLTSVDLAHIESERVKNHERHLRAIEDQMIKSKQGERALKRSEGDVKRDQRQIRQSIREFETGRYRHAFPLTHIIYIIIFTYILIKK